MPQLGSLPKTPVLHLLGAGNMPQYLFSQALSQGKASFDVTTSSLESTLRNVAQLKQQFPNARISAETSSFDARTPAHTGNSPMTAVISVKPQIFKEMSGFPCSFTKPDAFVVSMMAGMPNSKIQEKLGLETQPVRIMPNLPAKVGCGVVGLLKSNDFMQDERQADFEALLGQSSLIINLPEEEGFHWVTAVAGSGPAFTWEVVKRIEHLVTEGALDATGDAPEPAAVKNTAIALLTEIAQAGLATEPLTLAHAEKLDTFVPGNAQQPLSVTPAVRRQIEQEVMAFVNGVKAATLTENASAGHGASTGDTPPIVSDTNLTAAIYGTLLGSARLYAESTKSLPDLQTAVRSNKGTTDAGLNVLTAREAPEPHLENTHPITEEVAKDTTMAAMDRSKALSG